MLRVLIIDDDPAIRLVTKRQLKLMKCDAYEARDGLEGEALVYELQPDMVLLDIMMPQQDGYETCRNLRAQGFTGPILMFSALLRENERSIALKNGATDYLQKPVMRETLERYINLFTQNDAVVAS